MAPGIQAAGHNASAPLSHTCYNANERVKSGGPA